MSDNKFTILHPIPNYKQVNTRKGVSQYASALAAKGHDVELVIYDSKNSNTEQIDIEGVEIRRIAADGIWRIFSVIPVLLQCKSDVFLTQFFGKKDFIWAPICWLCGIKYTIMFDYTPKGKEISPLLYYLIKLKLIYLSIFVNTFFAKTGRSRNELCSICPSIESQTELLSSGVGDIHFQSKDRRSRKTIMYAGRLIDDKNVGLLVEAFNQLKDQYEDWVLEIAGDGPQSYNIANTDRIEYRGFLEENELLALYARADVFCLPSLHESFSNVLIEAAAAETAIVSTEVGVAPDLLDKTGVLVDKNNIDSLKDGLEVYMVSPERADQDGQVLRKEAEKYRLSNVVVSLEELV